MHFTKSFYFIPLKYYNFFLGKGNCKILTVQIKYNNKLHMVVMSAWIYHPLPPPNSPYPFFFLYSGESKSRFGNYWSIYVNLTDDDTQIYTWELQQDTSYNESIRSKLNLSQTTREFQAWKTTYKLICVFWCIATRVILSLQYWHA